MFLPLLCIHDHEFNKKNVLYSVAIAIEFVRFLLHIMRAPLLTPILYNNSNLKLFTIVQSVASKRGGVYCEVHAGYMQDPVIGRAGSNPR